MKIRNAMKPQAFNPAIKIDDAKKIWKQQIKTANQSVTLHGKRRSGAESGEVPCVTGDTKETKEGAE